LIFFAVFGDAASTGRVYDGAYDILGCTAAGSACHLHHAGFLLGLLLEPEDEGEMFFRNVGLCPNYTALQHR
jgi:hypothetical protein